MDDDVVEYGELDVGSNDLLFILEMKSFVVLGDVVDV